MHIADITIYNSHSDELLLVALLMATLIVAALLTVLWKYRHVPSEIWEMLNK